MDVSVIENIYYGAPVSLYNVIFIGLALIDVIAFIFFICVSNAIDCASDGGCGLCDTNGVCNYQGVAVIVCVLLPVMDTVSSLAAPDSLCNYVAVGHAVGNIYCIAAAVAECPCTDFQVVTGSVGFGIGLCCCQCIC